MDVPRLRGLLCIYYITAHGLACVCGRVYTVCASFLVSVHRSSVLHTLRETHTRERYSEVLIYLLASPLLLCVYIFYQSCRPPPIRIAPLLYHRSLGPVCISCPLSHMVGSQWSDAWLLMIEPSLTNRRYHLCKPLPVPHPHSAHKNV